jgi:putative mRNA 3-end processing factor
VFIDPWKAVPKALITHAHADHARYGLGAYISANDSVPILKHRLGQFINIQGWDWRESFMINGVKFSFHPAGHIIGSAQIRVEHKGEIWVVSGDYKREDDHLSLPFEVVKCHSFITESTFGLPSFNWVDQKIVYNDINNWWQENAKNNRPSIISAYSLGKAQRLINNLGDVGPIFCHGAIFATNEVLRRQGMPIRQGQQIVVNTNPKEYPGSIIICPPAAVNSLWARKFKHPKTAAVSGWMAMRGARRRRGMDIGFVLSDHADWNALNDTIAETGAENIYVTHGYTDIFSRWLIEKGYNAQIVKTSFGEEKEDDENLIETNEINIQ